ncbi:MAG: L-threonylcarbamoyladenylate synthase [Candidatus Shapirobacteria bacterium]|nr:L-threonylcarbamoyladenylate synthase [Candidatus Shapirobacteria bacterium]MDD5073599.1 L-threonylcarbamoyladenylate synthase [Candidatus Shapirobacteria bacterium]MDD5481352.1 L-threonylcarbamoyladenylate synthase [Candidatus Shapirobacteria bacterium]
MKIVKIKHQNQKKIIEKAVCVLKEGGLVIYPTETCYGAGVDATNPEAVDKLWHYKKERGNKPVLVAVADQAMAQKYAHLTPPAKKIFRQYLPGPVSLVINGRGLVDSRIESSLGTLGIRVPNHQLILALIKKLNRPLTSTSANVSGQPNPYSIDEILKQTNQNLIDLIIDQGTLPSRPPSTLVDMTGNKIKILRQGQIIIKPGS